MDVDNLSIRLDFAEASLSPYESIKCVMNAGQMDFSQTEDIEPK